MIRDFRKDFWMFMRYFKLLTINIILFLILLFTVNWISGLILHSGDRTKRSELPNYKNDPLHAKKIFQEYNQIQHQYEPFVGWKALPFNGESLNINKSGRRIVHSQDNTNLSEAKIIRFFGGSTLWGEGVSDNQTIPGLFYRKNPEYRVYNHAQLAYNSRQNLDELISVISQGSEFDIVVFYDGVNDAAFLCPSEINVPGHRLVPTFRKRLYTKKIDFLWIVLDELFLENINALIGKITKMKKTSRYNCFNNEPKIEMIAETFVKNWEIAHQLVTTRGGTFIAILQPVAFIGTPELSHLPNLDKDLGKNVAAVYKRIKKKIAEKQHSWIYDMTDKFNSNKYIYIDFCHVSANGNEIIADAIGKICSEDLDL